MPLFPDFRRFRKPSLLYAASVSMLLLVPVSPALGQSSPVLTFTPASPISTEPLVIHLTDSTVPEGTAFSLTVFEQHSPGSYEGSCTAVQQGGVASCQIGRTPAGSYALIIHGPDMGAYDRSINFTISGPGDNTVSALQGQYAFFVTHASPGNGSAPSAGAATGSFTADGTGNITAGVVDINTGSTAFQNLPVTGTYQLNAQGQGVISLATSQGSIQFAVSVPVRQTITHVESANLAATAGGLVSGGGSLVSQSGLIQNLAPVNPGFAPTLNNSYAATLTGEASPQPAAVGGAAQFAFTPGGSVTASAHFTVNGGGVDLNGLEGTYSPVDGTTGRTVLQFSGQPAMSYAVYETSQQTFYFVSLAPHSSNALLAGTATATE